jgi:hypothetical protein
MYLHIKKYIIAGIYPTFRITQKCPFMMYGKTFIHLIGNPRKGNHINAVAHHICGIDYPVADLQNRAAGNKIFTYIGNSNRNSVYSNSRFGKIIIKPFGKRKDYIMFVICNVYWESSYSRCIISLVKRQCCFGKMFGGVTVLFTGEL